MEPSRFVTTEQTLWDGIKVYESTLQRKAEDRTVIIEFEHGIMFAIFDGHCGSESAEFASKHLPQLVIDQFNPTASDVDQARVIKQIFEDFDRSLLLKVTELFPPGEDWSDEHWADPDNVHEVIGYGREDQQFRDGRPAVVGTTVLIGIVDKGKKNVWIASLGDSDAVCGRMQNGTMTPIFLSDRHNGSNPAEVERLLAEHPGEVDVVPHGAVVGVLRVTRALGDHQLKVQSRLLAKRILGYFYPSIVPPAQFEVWDRNRNLTPPYLSSTPTVARYDLLPGDMLVFASDGLRDALWPLPAGARWDVIMALLDNKDHDKLTHPRIIIQPVSGDNPAEVLIKNVLFGTDATKMANQLVNAALDDISVVVVDLGWKEGME